MAAGVTCAPAVLPGLHPVVAQRGQSHHSSAACISTPAENRGSALQPPCCARGQAVATSHESSPIFLSLPPV